jgi:hypothetical protein
MLSSHRTLDRLRRGCAWTLLTGGGLVASTTPAVAADTASQPGQTLQAQERRILIPATQDPGSGMRLNATGRPVTLTIPTRDGSVYLGDIVVTIDENDVIAVSAQRLLDLLANVVDPDVLRTLQQSAAGRTTLSPSDFESIGIRIRYSPQELALILDIAAERRATRSLQVSPLDRDRVGSFVQPADFSAYLNVRGNLDYLWEGQNDGLQSPVMFLDGAARLLGTVAESEAIWQPGATGIDFQRLGAGPPATSKRSAAASRLPRTSPAFRSSAPTVYFNRSGSFDRAATARSGLSALPPWKCSSTAWRCAACSLPPAITTFATSRSLRARTTYVLPSSTTRGAPKSASMPAYCPHWPGAARLTRTTSP